MLEKAMLKKCGCDKTPLMNTLVMSVSMTETTSQSDNVSDLAAAESDVSWDEEREDTVLRGFNQYKEMDIHMPIRLAPVLYYDTKEEKDCKPAKQCLGLGKMQVKEKRNQPDQISTVTQILHKLLSAFGSLIQHQQQGLFQGGIPLPVGLFDVEMNVQDNVGPLSQQPFTCHENGKPAKKQGL